MLLLFKFVIQNDPTGGFISCRLHCDFKSNWRVNEVLATLAWKLFDKNMYVSFWNINLLRIFENSPNFIVWFHILVKWLASFIFLLLLLVKIMFIFRWNRKMIYQVINFEWFYLSHWRWAHRSREKISVWQASKFKYQRLNFGM